jgi:glycerol uptake facilitator-like aquaporin
MARRVVAELLGTASLVFFGAGVATLAFGFGVTGSRFAAGVAFMRCSLPRLRPKSTPARRNS